MKCPSCNWRLADVIKSGTILNISMIKDETKQMAIKCRQCKKVVYVTIR